MRNMLLIAKREYLEQVRGRTFRVTTILLPAIFALVFGIMFFSSRFLGHGRHMVVAFQDPGLAEQVRDQIFSDKKTQTKVDVYAPQTPGVLTAADKAVLIGEVDRKEIDGFLWIEQKPSGELSATYESRSSGDFVTGARMEGAFNDGRQRWELNHRDLKKGDIDTVMKNVEIGTLQIKHGKELQSNAISSFYTGYVMALLLTMTTMIYGLNVGRSVIQEKTSRIFEVMLATCKAGDLLAGKLIGVGAVGLTQIGIWIVTAAILLGTPVAEEMFVQKYQVHISPVQVVLFAVYFLLGYSLNSALFAGLGATLETEQELQQYSPLAAVPVWLSFSMIVLISTDPDSKWVVLASLFPPCTPIVMFLRMGSQMPPSWQIFLSVGIMIAAIAGVLWFSARLYRIGILMYGKRATLPEIVRWLRYS
jgi:ABC-2 type transport system permease protein